MYDFLLPPGIKGLKRQLFILKTEGSYYFLNYYFFVHPQVSLGVPYKNLYKINKLKYQ